MTTLQLLARNLRDHGTRDPYPADAATITELSRMNPMAASVGPRGALLEPCVTWERGKPIHVHVFRLHGDLWVRLSTRAEYAA